MPATRIVIDLTNPWTGARVAHDVTDLSQAALDSLAVLMDDDLREDLGRTLAPCTPGEFLAAWAARVGDKEASRVILGS